MIIEICPQIGWASDYQLPEMRIVILLLKPGFHMCLRHAWDMSQALKAYYLNSPTYYGISACISLYLHVQCTLYLIQE